MESSNKENKEIKISDIINSGEKQDVLGYTENKEEKKVIFDININSLEYLIKYLISKGYDFFTLEPEENKVKVSFRKDNMIKESKYIKYPIYTNILLKAKNLTKLDLTENTKSQEGKTEINLDKKRYKVLSKTTISDFGEKLFLKVVEIPKAIAKKKKKMSFSKMMGIFGGLLFTTLVISGVFLTIILMRSTSVADLQFFNNLGIDTNAIKDFAASLVNWTFGFIMLVIILLLFIFSYKAFLTKKEFKKQRITRMILSIFFLILSVLTLILWMFLYQKINSLRGLNYGKIEFYDNSKYNSELFDKNSSKIDINENLIGPITIRFNNKEFIQKLIDEGFKPQKIVWNVNGDIIEKPAKDYELIYTFKDKGLYKISIEVEGRNIKGDPETKQTSLGVVNINNAVKITEIKLDNGGSKFIFDASDLKYLGKIKWYYIPSLKGKDNNEINKIITKALSKELLTGYRFNSKNIFSGEEYYGIKILSGNENKEGLDKIFVINKGDTTNTKGEIIKKQNPEDYNKFTFSFKSKDDSLGKAYIKEFIWEIEDYNTDGNPNTVKIRKKANLSNLEESSKIYYNFKKAGTHKIKLKVIDSDNKESFFNDKIEIKKQLGLRTYLKFYNEGKELKYKTDFNYDKKDHTYNIDDLGAPTVLKVNAIKIKPLNPKYGLEDIKWDLDNDGVFEKNGKTATININKGGLLSFKVKYIFVNKNIKTDKIEVVETIHTSAIEKEAILDLQIIKSNSYVPIIVGFDATNSKVTGKDIDKFIFNYGDGTPPEERDAKNTGHKYLKAGDYNVKLTVVTTDGLKYSINKKLVLKNRPQEAKITVSMKKAPVFQAIDFSAENSTGEVASYFWDFGDGTTSTDISPDHFYKKPGKYKVKLTLEYTNKNIDTDEVFLDIYKD